MKIKSVLQNVSHDARKFVQLQVLFAGMNAILTLFINTFLLNAFGSFSQEVLLYNMILALVQPVAMITATKLTEAKNALFTQRIGFVFYGTALVILCLFGQKVSPLYPVFSALLSFGAGYYFSVYSSQMLHYTDDTNRDFLAGIMNLLGSIISIFLPMLSGVVIACFGEEVGYTAVFGLAALLALGGLLTGGKLSPLPKHKKEPVFRKIATTVLGDKNGRRIMIANGLSNCRSATIPIFVTLLFYNLSPNELLISANSTAGYVATLLGAAVYGVIVKNNNRVKFSILASCAVTVPVLCMVFGLTLTLIVIFNAVYGFFSTFTATPVLNTHFKVMEDLHLGSEYGAEVHLFREFFVSAGRILGLAMVWLIPQTNTGAIVVLICMSVFELINSALLHAIEKSA